MWHIVKLPLSKRRQFILEAFFCHICWNSLHIPKAIIKSNALTKIKKSVSIIFFGTDSNIGCPTCLSTYLPTCVAHCKLRTRLGKTSAKACELAICSGFGWGPEARGGFFLLHFLKSSFLFKFAYPSFENNTA